MIPDVIQAVKRFMTSELGLQADVVAVERNEEGWLVTAETILIDEYMRRFARRDLVATFELRVNDQCQVLSYLRKTMRERGSIPE